MPRTERAGGTDQVFSALASPVRREVLRMLRDEGDQSVRSMAEHFAMARPSFSEHLRALREAGLVSERREGRQRLYSLEAVPLAEVQDWLHPFERFWRDRLSALGDVLDEMDDAEDAGGADGPGDTGPQDATDQRDEHEAHEGEERP
ncbi:metalloregulator ArsR/SmtB family transcription factor [Nocardiopsis sp. RSe5-2]|uniref:Metalloregulator ArsR/SmtB family transcription factor n=1 Tax=Nocardiopsis endophytica TaxID=3018445 RepID=A0ABT4UD85_9ACTN|nr:metalloregulator ArsR/SmtB family transcription factor [Nocardiopsis endophytica]MDA2814868.1 metalloregulator ArsR/SmtB family transcription factor [Nocardiopsis endophytica]